MNVNNRKRKFGILPLLGLFLLFGVTYALTTPIFEASDELWHYPMVKTLADGNPLPVQDPSNVGDWRQEASQPPLYYALMALATAWIDTSDLPQVRWLNPHANSGIVTPDGNINLAIHTQAESLAEPWQGTVLAVRLIRLLSILMGAGTVLCTYVMAIEFFATEPDRLAAAAFVAFLPMFNFIAGAVNNDNLASLLSAATLMVLVHLARRRDWGWFSRFGARAGLVASVALGTLLGLAALTKQSALGLFPLTALTLLILAVRSVPFRFNRAQGMKGLLDLFSQAAIVFGLAAMIAGWWYYRNLILYGDLLGWTAFIAVLGQRATPASLAQLWGEREGFLQSFWGLFGGVNVPMADWVYLTLNTLGGIAIMGGGIFFVQQLWLFARRGPGLSIDSQRWLPYLLIAGHIALIGYGLIGWATVTWSSQGRLVFSGVSALAIWFILGLRTILPSGVRSLGLGAIATFMAAVTAGAPLAWIAPAYAEPAPLTSDQITAIPNPTNIEFGAINFPAEMRLLGYALSTNALAPGQSFSLTLYWESLVAMDRDWSVFVHVIDENEIIVAQRDTYPGRGLMPTRKWRPGQMLADTYLLHLPAATYAPASARIVIGLYDYASGERLLIASGEQSGRDALMLAPLSIVAPGGAIPNPQELNFGNQIDLVGYQMDKRVIAPGESLTLMLYWRARQRMAANYSVFAQVRGAGESVWAQVDSWPQAGNNPTSAWTPDAIIGDPYVLTLKPDTNAGLYDIEVGLYDEEGIRLQVVTDDGRLTDTYVDLAKIRVSP